MARLTLAGALGMTGCSGIKGYPDPPASLPTTMRSLDAASLKDLIARYNASDTGAAERKQARNRIIFSGIGQIDESYNDFKLLLNTQNNITTLGAEWIVLILAGLGATTTHGATAAALAAAAGGVIAAKGVLDKDVLYQKTIVALITQMEAQRNFVFARMLANMRQEAVDYPLEAAGRDLQDYYQAGTLVAALQGITQSAGEKAAVADAEVARVIAVKYGADDNSKPLRDYWRPGGKVDAAHTKVIQACMQSLKITVLITQLIEGDDAAGRKSVLECVRKQEGG